jgi:hypothetical protein
MAARDKYRVIVPLPGYLATPLPCNKVHGILAFQSDVAQRPIADSLAYTRQLESGARNATFVACGGDVNFADWLSINNDGDGALWRRSNI